MLTFLNGWGAAVVCIFQLTRNTFSIAKNESSNNKCQSKMVTYLQKHEWLISQQLNDQWIKKTNKKWNVNGANELIQWFGSVCFSNFFQFFNCVSFIEIIFIYNVSLAERINNNLIPFVFVCVCVSCDLLPSLR